MSEPTLAQRDLTAITAHLSRRASPPWIWIFCGDSITQGVAYTRGARAFPEIFAERVRWEKLFLHDLVINTGISGHTTVDLLRNDQYERRIRRHGPRAVFLLIGMNDTVKLDDPGKFRANLAELVRRVRADGAIPILQTNPTVLLVPENPNYRKRYELLPTYNAAIRETAESESVILVDHDRRWRTDAADAEILRTWLGDDPIHPGARGHVEMAKEIFRALGIDSPDAPCLNNGF